MLEKFTLSDSKAFHTFTTPSAKKCVPNWATNKLHTVRAFSYYNKRLDRFNYFSTPASLLWFRRDVNRWQYISTLQWLTSGLKYRQNTRYHQLEVAASPLRLTTRRFTMRYDVLRQGESFNVCRRSRSVLEDGIKHRKPIGETKPRYRQLRLQSKRRPSCGPDRPHGRIHVLKTRRSVPSPTLTFLAPHSFPSSLLSLRLSLSLPYRSRPFVPSNKLFSGSPFLSILLQSPEDL